MGERILRILIAGAGTAGWWNAGDEAIFKSMLADFRRYSENVEITLVSDNPKGAFQAYNIIEIPFREIDKLVDAARACDVMVLGGGGVFYDYWGANTEEILTRDHVGLGIYAGFALLSTLVDKPLVIYGVGIGPLFSDAGKAVTKAIFEQSALITVRDSESRDLIIELGINADKVQVAIDPVFSMDKTEIEIGKQVLRDNSYNNLDKQLLVGVVLRSWESKSISGQEQEWEKQIAHALDHFAETHDASFVFIPFHRTIENANSSDILTAKRVINLMKNTHRTICVEASLSLDEKASILENCNLVVGMRLHSLIFAIRSGIPVVAIAYDAKVSHLMNAIGQPEYCIDVPEISYQTFYTMLANAYSNRQKLGRKLHNLANLFKRVSQKQAKLFLSFAAQNKTRAGDHLAHPALPPLLSTSFINLILMNYEKSTRLVSLQEQNTSLQEQNTSLQEQNTSLQEQNTSLQEQKYHITNEIVELKIRQNEILNSRVWKFSVQLRRIYRTFVPNNSFLEKLILGLINLHHSPVGIRSFLAKSGRFIYRYLPHNQQSRLREEKIKEQNLSNSISDVILNHTESLQQNLSHKNEKTVNLVVSTFFDFDGNNMFFGGAERYLIELVRLIRQLGYNVEVYQCGNDGWVRYYQDIRVTGIATPGLVKELKQKFHQQVEDGQLTIYFAFFIASDRYKTPSIGISHGIYWDDADLHGSASAKEEVTTDVLNAISHVSTLVSVDTNTINWLRATEFSLSKHCVYIPNFVDLEQFPPTQLNNGRDNQRVVILYPRRLYDARGFWLVERLVAEFIEKYPEVDFHFVGKANAKEEHAVQELITRFPERVKWYFLPPEKMHEAYQQAHIALIPTVQSEGTSLSCLEALSSGNAVIATNVGGLPNLIFPDYNGLLIEPNVESLRKALTQLIENPKLRLQYSQRGIEIAATFNIEIWRERWKTTLQKYLPAKESLNITPLTAVFFPKPDQTWLTSSRTRMRRLAEQLAESGVEVFWVEPSDRRPSGINRVHLIGTGDDLYLSHPWVIINNQDAIAHLQKYDKPISIFDIDEFPSDQVKQIATLVDYIIASSDKLSSNANIENGNFYCIPDGATLKKLLLQMSRQDF